MHPRLNHWWHVPLYVSSRINNAPHSLLRRSFEIEFDLIDHRLVISTSTGDREDFALRRAFGRRFLHEHFCQSKEARHQTKIRPIPYEVHNAFPEDTENASYDKEYVRRFHQTLVAVDDVLEEFRGRFLGKSTPVHMFWHSFDVALTFFRQRVPVREGANRVERGLFARVISFGFCSAMTVPAPAFYAYVAPEPPDSPTSL